LRLRVDASDPARIPAIPYWRMVVLDEYRDGGVSDLARVESELTRSTRTNSFLRGAPAAADLPVVWTFYLESGSAVPATRGAICAAAVSRAAIVQNLVSWGLWRCANEPVSMTAYRVEGMATDGFMPDRLFGDALRRAQQTPPAPAVGSKASVTRPRSRTIIPHALGLPSAPPTWPLCSGWSGRFPGCPGSAAEFAVRAAPRLDDAMDIR